MERMNMYIRSEGIERSVRFVRIYHFIGIFMILIMAISLHFTYAWSGENFLVSLMSPVNESIWEHLKMIYWPTLLWWVFGYVIFRNRRRLSGKRWVQSMSVSLIFGMLIIVLWYYTWSGAMGIEAEWVNLSSMISVVMGQLLAIHVYRVAKPRWIYVVTGMVMIVSLAFMSGFFTYYPPALPMFVPPS